MSRAETPRVAFCDPDQLVVASTESSAGVNTVSRNRRTNLFLDHGKVLMNARWMSFVCVVQVLLAIALVEGKADESAQADSAQDERASESESLTPESGVDQAAAKELIREGAAWREEQQRKTAWRVVDARQRITDFSWLANATEEQTKEWHRSNALVGEVNQAYEAGRFADALKPAKQHAEIIRDLFGDEDRKYGEDLSMLGMLYEDLGEYSRSIEYYDQSREILRKALGKYHPEHAVVLNNLAALHAGTNDHERALALYHEAQEIWEKTLGKNHEDYISSVSNVGMLYHTIGEYQQSLSTMEEALAMTERTAGKLNQSYATSLNNLAVVCNTMGDYPRAVKLYEEACDIKAQTIGMDHPAYATSLGNLAAQYHLLGDYEKAIEVMERARSLHARTLGTSHPDYAYSLGNLATLHTAKGDYSRALPLLEAALTIREEVYGREHPIYAESLDALAGLYNAIGDKHRAATLYEEARTILESTLGKHHPGYAATVNNLAGIYHDLGDSLRALQLFEEVRANWETTLGKNHPQYATNLCNMAVVKISLGEHATALDLYKQALSIREQSLGKDHAEYAHVLQNMASAYQAIGDPVRARDYAARALEIRARALGTRHPAYAANLNNLAGAHSALGDDVKAAELFDQALAIGRETLEASAMILTEEQQLIQAESQRHQLDNLLLCLIRLKGRDHQAWSVVLAFKGATLARQKALRQLSLEPELVDLTRQLQDITRQWAALARMTPDPKQATVIREKIQELQREREQLERGLAERSAPFREAISDVTPTHIAESLPPDTALIDYLVVKGKSRDQLVVFVVTASGTPKMIDLGPLDAIATDIATWRASFGIRQESISAGNRLRQRLWEPLIDVIGDCSTVLISPDGVLGTLPFAGLPGANPNSYLLEDYRIVVVPVPRLIPASTTVKQMDKAASVEMLVFGGIDYDSAELTKPTDSPGRSDATETSIELVAPTGTDTRIITAGKATWAPLPGAREEATLVRRLYEQIGAKPNETVLDFQGTRATESAFRTIAPRCRLIHLATHGYFAPPEKQSAIQRRSEDLMLLPRSAGTNHFHGFSPGLLSGVVFAGANSPPPVPDCSDDNRRASRRWYSHGQRNRNLAAARC